MATKLLIIDVTNKCWIESEVPAELRALHVNGEWMSVVVQSVKDYQHSHRLRTRMSSCFRPKLSAGGDEFLENLEQTCQLANMKPHLHNRVKFRCALENISSKKSKPIIIVEYSTPHLDAAPTQSQVAIRRPVIQPIIETSIESMNRSVDEGIKTVENAEEHTFENLWST